MEQRQMQPDGSGNRAYAGGGRGGKGVRSHLLPAFEENLMEQEQNSFDECRNRAHADGGCWRLRFKALLAFSAGMCLAAAPFAGTDAQAAESTRPPAGAAKPGPKSPIAAAPAVKPPPPKGENENDEPDPPRPPRMALKTPRLSAGARTQHLKDHRRGEEIMRDVVQALKDKEINVALLGGEKYMVNNCLGIKASAGTFRLKLASPNLRWEGTGVRLTFRIDKIAMNALSVRFRPNPTNAAYPCHFSKRRTIGGSASKVTLEYSFDPILDLQQCKLGSLGTIRQRVGIGGLNLKPMQNDLDRVAKNMVEDAINNVFEFDMTDRVIAATNAILGVKCRA